MQPQTPYSKFYANSSSFEFWLYAAVTVAVFVGKNTLCLTFIIRLCPLLKVIDINLYFLPKT